MKIVLNLHLWVGETGLILDDINAVKQYIQRFEKLKINAKKEKIRGLDPLVKALHNPIQ